MKLLIDYYKCMLKVVESPRNDVQFLVEFPDSTNTTQFMVREKSCGDSLDVCVLYISVAL